MACSKQLTFGSGDTVYWGLADATSFDPATFNAWDDAQVAGLLAILNSENGPYRSSSDGYFFNNLDLANNKLGWFVVPDSFETPLAGIGMQYCEGSGVSPDEYIRQPDCDPPHYLSRAAILWAGYSDDTRSNEWGYYLRTISGKALRFYVIGQMQRNTPYIFGIHPDVYWFEQDSDFSQTVRSNNSPFTIPAWIRINIPTHPEFSSFGVYATTRTWGGDEGPFYFAIEGSPATYVDTPTQDYYCEPTQNITGVLDGTITLNEFTLFVFPQAVSQTGTTVYWGMAPAATYDPYDCQSWDQTKVDAFFGSLSSEVGSIRALPYDFTAGSANCVAWLVVPYSYPTIVPETGFVSNYMLDGTAGPGQVLDFRTTQYNGDGWLYYIVCNTHFKTNLANAVQTPFSFPAEDNEPQGDAYGGWNWFALKYNGIMYRAYPFVPKFPESLFLTNSYLRYWNDGFAGTDVSITVTTV